MGTDCTDVSDKFVCNMCTIVFCLLDYYGKKARLNPLRILDTKIF